MEEKKKDSDGQLPFTELWYGVRFWVGWFQRIVSIMMIAMGMSGFPFEYFELSRGAAPVLPHCEHPLFRFFVFYMTVGTVGEMSNWFGHMWILEKHRALPFWPLPLPPFQALSRELFFNPILNNGLVFAFLLNLLLVNLIPNYYLLASAVILFWTLALLDLWRLAYYHYWLFGLTALLFPGYLISLQFILGGLYFFAGFYKLFQPEFYVTIGPYAFEPVFAFLEKYSLFRLLLTSPDPKKHTKVKLAVMVLLVSPECGLGFLYILLAGYGFQPLSTNLVWLVTVALAFNVAMHIYIIIFIGWKRQIETFVNWNFFVAGLSALVFSPSAFYRPSEAISTEPAFQEFFRHATEWSPCVWVICLVFIIYPISYIFGMCWNDCWAHAYFAPGWSGSSYLLFSKKALPRLPPRVRGCAIKPHRGRALNALLDIAYKKYGLQKLAHHFGINVPSQSKLQEELVAIDGQIVTLTHIYDANDPAREYFGASQNSFWRVVTSQLLLTPGVNIIQSQFVGTGYEDQAFLIPK